MRVELHTDETVLEHLVAEWGTLHAQSPTATVFNSPDWCCVWWRYYGQEAGRLHVLVARDEAGRLVGLAPLVVTVDRQCESTRPVVRFVGDREVCDYLDVLVAPGYEQAVLERFLDTWRELTCECELDLYPIPHTSPLGQYLPDLASQRDLRVSSSVQDVCPVVQLPNTWETYLRQLDARDRRELRRKLRQAGHRAFTGWYYVTQPCQVAEDLPLFFALHRASDPEKAAFMDSRREAFFRDAFLALAQHGWIWLAFLHVNGEPAASFLCFDFRNEIQVYNSGLDPTLASNLSPGWVLLGYLIEHAIHLGRRRFNFLRGNEEYKYQFGAKSEPVYHLRVAPRAPADAAR